MVMALAGGAASRASAVFARIVCLAIACLTLLGGSVPLAAAASPSGAELVHNGDFGLFTPCFGCNGPSIPTWDVFAVPYDVDATTGALSVQQGGTTLALVRHHLKNPFVAGMTELVAGAGAPFTLSFRVQVSEPAYVRCLLTLQDATGFPKPLTLAERTVQTPGVWTTLVGTVPPSWTGTLLNADLLFEVRKVVTGSTISPSTTNDQNPFPTFSLDDVSLIRDVDGDGLTDREEQTCAPAPGCAVSPCGAAGTPWTSATTTDTDGDGLPDGWEWRHCQNPADPADGDGSGLPASFCGSSPTPCGGVPAVTPPAWDPDCDGATNVEEYWAATEPSDECSVPGQPATANATAAARELLRYLAVLPSHGAQDHALVGQHLADPLAPITLPNGVVSSEYCHFIGDLTATTGEVPAILSLEYDDCDVTQCSDPAALIGRVNARAIDHWKKGGVVLIKWSPPNPWTQLPYGGPIASVRSNNGLQDDPNVDLAALAAGTNVRFNSYLADVAAGLLELEKAGVVVLFRPAPEMTAKNFWWGARPRDAYVAFWHYMFDTLTTQYQLDNLLWVYESDSSSFANVPVDYYYPGDAYVDVYGHNFYEDDFRFDFDALTLSRNYPKVYAFPQAGPDLLARRHLGPVHVPDGHARIGRRPPVRLRPGLVFRGVELLRVLRRGDQRDLQLPRAGVPGRRAGRQCQGALADQPDDRPVGDHAERGLGPHAVVLRRAEKSGRDGRGLRGSLSPVHLHEGGRWPRARWVPLRRRGRLHAA